MNPKYPVFLFVVTIWFLGFSPSRLPAQSPRVQAAAQEFWNNPTFVNQFLGSYGVLSEREPKVTAEENKVLKAVVEQIKTSPEAAANTLQRQVTPESSAALDFTLATLLVQVGKFDAAAQSYQNALRKFPDFMRAHKNLGMIYVLQQKYTEALAELTKALELGGEDSRIYGLMGYCYLILENNLSAEAAYRKAILFDPKNEAG